MFANNTPFDTQTTQILIEVQNQIYAWFESHIDVPVVVEWKITNTERWRDGARDERIP